MSHFERLLQDDLNRLIDRIAVRAGKDTAAGLKSDLRAHIERAEERLTVLRAALLDGYAEWSGRWTSARTSGPWRGSGARRRTRRLSSEPPGRQDCPKSRLSQPGLAGSARRSSASGCW